ncbi:MAG: FtsW/RodA/SpoVE family cell cycle protein [Actinomycetota bacterium]|jgi:cell division protein FtsW (lipid II flippase)/cell division protein FtsI/penicillin-binding protein 2|nr:FtsW/RodA/SpoVE family cell cycle protein [Actinomycetota bacterium]
MRSRRNTELLLLSATSPVVLLAFALVHGHATGGLSFKDFAVPIGLLGAFAVAHLAARLLTPEADPLLLPLACLLSGIGLAFVTRLDPELGGSQTLWFIAGVAALIGTMAGVRSLERLARYKYTVMLAGLTLILLPAVVGREVNGAKLWLRVAGYSFQPAEIAKLLVVIFLASYLAENREVLSVSTKRFMRVWLPPVRRLGPLLLMWIISLVVLIAEKDLGSSLVFFGVFVVMLYAATGRMSWVALGTAEFGVGATFAYFTFSHVQTRMAIWLDPFADAAGRGYQLVQSLFAFGAGGVTGVGVGNGLPGRIPFVETDFIFAAIGEELGLLGAAALVIIYLLFCMRGLATASRARSDVAMLTAVGLVATFGLQAFVIIGGVTRLIPLTGITLPFVSYGGSSILSNFILLGLLMRAGDAATGRDTEIESLDDTGTLGRFALSSRLLRVTIALSLLMAALIINLTWLQVAQAPALAANPANTRNLTAGLNSPRGSIVSADAVVLAQSVLEGDTYRREYPLGSTASHVLGYFSTIHGRTGIEAAMTETLSGDRSFTTLADAVDAAAGLPVAGNDVRLTIDTREQRAAEEALAGRTGAVVAIDPSTGAILALASSPAYDPNDVDTLIASLDQGVEGAPLVNRATTSLYPPGSTFKVVTLTGALGAGIATSDTIYPAPASIEIGGAPVTNYGGSGYGPMPLSEATRRSVNTVFGQLAVELGAQDLVAQSNRFGFADEPPLRIPVVASLMPDPDEMTEWETAWAGVGQPVGEHDSPPGPQVTALQMTLVAAGIGNGGEIMRPYLVASITDEAGRVLSSAEPRKWKTATDPATAATVRDLMVGVVESGSGTRAQISGVSVAGKTGTAEVGKGIATHAWFIAFAPAEAPRVAVAIVLENAGVGGVEAAPAARTILEAALAIER